jgi:hypothetical protein
VLADLEDIGISQGTSLDDTETHRLLMYRSYRDATDLVGKRIAFAGESGGSKMVGATNNNMTIGWRQLRYRGIALSGFGFGRPREKVLPTK